MKIKSGINIIILASALSVSSLVFAAGGGPATESEPLGVENDATLITKEVNDDFEFWFNIVTP